MDLTQKDIEPPCQAGDGAKFQRYSHMENIAKVPAIHDQECVVTEKIHGTNVRIGKFGGKLWLGSRNGVIYDGVSYFAAYDMFKFKEWVDKHWGIHNLEMFLPDDVIWIGEFFGTGIQREIDYFAGNGQPKRDFLVFDVIWKGKYLSHDEKIDVMNSIRFEDRVVFRWVPILHRGKITTELLNRLVNQPSVVGYHPMVREGVVVTPVIEQTLHTGSRMIAKYKSPKFSESTAVITKDLKETSKWFREGEGESTYARVVNAIDKFRVLGFDPELRHMSTLVDIVKYDALLELADGILDPEAKKEFGRGAASRVLGYFNEWLKKEP